jgi:hypothetical protein
VLSPALYVHAVASSASSVAAVRMASHAVAELRSSVVDAQASKSGSPAASVSTVEEHVVGVEQVTA